MQKKEGGNSSNFSMSLKHEYGYYFSYSGNGIDERDTAEIEKAMKIIKPMFEKFLQSVQKSEEIPGMKEITNVAQLFKSKMPEVKNDDMLNMLKSSTVDTMDEVLSAFEKSRVLIESSKKLFDRLFDNMKNFEIYA